MEFLYTPHSTAGSWTAGMASSHMLLIFQILHRPRNTILPYFSGSWYMRSFKIFYQYVACRARFLTVRRVPAFLSGTVNATASSCSKCQIRDEVYLDPKSRSNNGPKLFKKAQRASILNAVVGFTNPGLKPDRLFGTPKGRSPRPALPHKKKGDTWTFKCTSFLGSILPRGSNVAPCWASILLYIVIAKQNARHTQKVTTLEPLGDIQTERQ